MMINFAPSPHNCFSLSLSLPLTEAIQRREKREKKSSERKRGREIVGKERQIEAEKEILERERDGQTGEERYFEKRDK